MSRNPAEILTKVEYRVKPVTRYIITRYEEGHDTTVEEGPGKWSSTSQHHGEFDNADMALEVGYAICKIEHERLGWPVGDDRIQYPTLPGKKLAEVQPA